MHDLQALGEALVELPEDRLRDVDMPEALRDAIAEFRRTRSHEGRRRQMQYIGKQMRLADAGPLRAAVEGFRSGSVQDARLLHGAERWREELLADEQALQRWVEAHPDTDLQRLRQLLRAARADALLAPEQRHGRAWRELFRFIKPHLAEP